MIIFTEETPFERLQRELNARFAVEEEMDDEDFREKYGFYPKHVESGDGE